jgi:hypothetical protein
MKWKDQTYNTSSFHLGMMLEIGHPESD